MDLSVVVPVYFNEETLEETHRRIRENLAARFPGLRIEFVFVDDGSEDGSFERLRDLCRRFDDVVAVKLARNFGQPRASLAGFAKATGRYAARIAADLQEPAGLVGDLYEAATASKAEAAIAERTSRDEGPWRRWTSFVFYGLLRAAAFPHMPSGGFDCMLVADPLYRALGDDAPPVFLQGALLKRVRNPARVRYSRVARTRGRSRWTFLKKLSFFWDGLFAYTRILQAILAGSALATAALLAGTVVRRSWILAALAIVFAVLGGAALRVFTRRQRQRRRREPLTVVEEVVRSSNHVHAG